MLKLHSVYLYVLFVFINEKSYSQNLIANPSLEDLNYCEEKMPCCPAAWYPVSLYPDGYENDFYKAHSGKRMLGFFISTTEDNRTYWQTKLLCPLQQGKLYQLSFYLYSPVIAFEENHFGAYFSEHKIASITDTILKFLNYLPVEKQYITIDIQSKWLKIALSFTATGKESYLVLGNFNQYNLFEDRHHISVKYIKYFIDDISLISLDKNIGSCIEYQYRKDSLYKTFTRHQFDNTNTTLLPTASVDTINHLPVTDTLILSAINFIFDSYRLVNTNTISEYFDNIRKDDIINIEVLGYTDSIGSPVYNNQLSLKRAEVVKSFLVNNYSFTNNQVTAVGKGISNKKRDIALNRRVEIIIYKNN